MRNPFSLISACVLSLGMTQAPATASEAESLGGPIAISGELNSDYGSDGTFRTDGYVKVSADVTDNIKAVLKLELDRYFYENGVEVDDDFDIETFIEEAYVEFSNHGGKLSAVIVGKKPIYFGSRASALPNSDNSPVDAATKLEQVYAVTVQFEDVGFLDLIEASVFESEGNDLNFGDVNGYAITLEKSITDKLSVIASAALTEREDDEKLITVGLVNHSGDWKSHAEFIYRDFDGQSAQQNNGVLGPQYAWEGDLAAVLGVAKKAGPGTVAVELSVIEDTLIQVGAGYNLHISDNMEIGPEIRYTDLDNGDSDTSVAVRLKLKFGHTAHHMSQKHEGE